MSQIGRVKAEWTGFIGAPGYTNIYFGLKGGTFAWSAAAAQEAVTGVRALLDYTANYPTTVNILVNPTVEVIDSDNGDLIELHTAATPPAAIVGTSTASVAGPAGACINWTTDGIHRNRRVRGRTFIVPLATTSYEPNGTIFPGFLTALRTNAAGFLTMSRTLVEPNIWARPYTVPETVGGPIPPTVLPGAAYRITSSSVADKVAVLRSRRD